MVGLAFTARDFYPRPPRGGRHHPAIISREQKEISIHALREEGDEDVRVSRQRRSISIHALREEGDM